MLEIIYSIVFFIVILTLFFSKNKPLAIFSLFVFFVPWFGLMVDLGIQINIDRLLVLLMVAYIFNKRKISVDHKSLLVFIFYAFTLTFIMSQILPDTAKFFSPLRGQYRYLVQIVVWSLFFIPVLFTSTYVKDKQTFENIYKLLIFSTSLLCFLGLIQFISMYLLSFDPFPIGLLEGDEKKRYGMFSYETVNIFRVSSLGGEPKHFGYTLAIILPLLITSLHLKVLNFRFSKSIVLIMLLILFLTFSTQGYLLFIANLLICILLIKIFKGFKKNLIYMILVTIVILILISKFSILYEIIKLRTIERFAESGFVEDWNEVVLNFLIDNPIYILIGVGLGNIHLHAQDYIPNYAMHYMLDNVFVAKSGALRMISEIGVIGFILFLISYFKPIVKLFRMSKNDSLALLNLIFGIYTFFTFTLSMTGPNYIFLSLAIMYSYVINIKRQI